MILVIDQLNAKILVLLISLLYSSPCFEHYCAHHQEHVVSSHYVGGLPMHRLGQSSPNLCKGGGGS